MAIRNIVGKYECSYCGKNFTSPQEADSCRDSHELIYVFFTLKELDSLIKYIYSRNESDLNPEVVKRLQRFMRRNIVKELSKSGH